MSSRKSPRLEATNQDAEVTHLREQVKLLARENEKLRSFIADHGLSGALSPKTKHEADGEHRERRAAHRSVIAHAPKAKSPNTPARPGTPRAPGRGCACKGNCSSRICGCVKRNIPCAEFCRCGDELCQNSEPDKENIGDPNHQPQLSKDAAESLTKLSQLALAENKESEPRHPALEPVNKRLEQIGKPRSLFSPDVPDHQFNFEMGDIESGNISLRFGDGPEAAEAEEEAVVEKPSDRNKNKKKKTRKEKNANVDDRELDLETVGDVQSEKVSPGRGDVPEGEDADEEAVVEKPSDRNKNKKKKTRKEKNANVDDREHDLETVGDVQSEKVLPGPGDVPETEEADEEAVVEKPSDRNKNKKKKTRKEKNANVDDRELDLETVGDVQSEMILLGPDDVPEAGEAAAEAVAEKTSDRKKNKKKKTKGEKNEDHEEHRKEKETHRSATTPDSKAANTDEEKVATDFDPMKPRRQLSRSPLVSKTVPRTERLMDASEIPLPAPLKEEPEDEPLEPEELKQDIVPDWDRHMANLVECTICRRKLYPHRIKKHEASCQNI